MANWPWVLLGIAGGMLFALGAVVGIRLIGRDGRTPSPHASLRAVDWVGDHLDQSKVGSLRFVWPLLLATSVLCFWFAFGNAVA
jgi:hypothetical protein